MNAQVPADKSDLYPPVEPYRRGRLRVSELHEIYFEESGNPSGKPVVFLHGGPGAGTEPNQRRFFNPGKYRIVLFDQRGCGQSTPYGSVEQNTTWDLVSDVETLRQHLGVARWQVFGGSWGSTLALAYAQQHPASVTELVLRGIFLLRKWEIKWFYQSGADALFPDAWERYVAPIPEAERGDMLGAYHRRLMGSDADEGRRVARAWSEWEASTSCLLPNPGLVARFGQDHFAHAFARIENHYFVNAAFFENDTQLLDRVGAIRHIPGVIVQGRYDIPCPVASAWALHRAWPEARLVIVPDAGHSSYEPGTSRALVAATDEFADKGVLSDRRKGVPSVGKGGGPGGGCGCGIRAPGGGVRWGV